MKHVLTATLLGLLAAPAFTATAFAEGNPAKGEKVFNRCKSCHTIVSDSGENIIKGGRTGPNLWGVVGRTAGTYEDFKYSDDLAAAGAAGLVWDLENFTGFTADPRGFLQTHLDDSKAKSKMTFKLKKGAEDLYAFLAQYGPAPEDTAEEAASE
ncbi:c-type cytochrome [Pseudophaeobacter flagellatus]|uniref:c-type cytochrome n=1 Tax=Pseudophaeobacter flagellatus TaxID=2899119 RepID=UPI001E5E6877|nr:c-type cytochrome [Pseudophaeobacter flagellatus]MCD9147370.1 c-type cytochrome [Pseudophaeobacter flagellatus]